jgi:hypothetical protein
MVGGHFKLEPEIFYRRPWIKIQFFYFHCFLTYKRSLKQMIWKSCIFDILLAFK